MAATGKTGGIDRLIRPRSVAIVGASTDPSKIAGRPLRYLKAHGFGGDIWPVNPRADEIDGIDCFADLASLPGVPDAAMILVGPAHVEGAVRSLAEMGCGAAVVLAGGFAEVGGEGEARQAALIEAAGGMRLLGPNTIGLLNITDATTLSASGALDVEHRFAGGVAIVSQSGGILGSLLSRAAARGVGLSRLVATGNEADVEVADLVDWLADDDATRVIALYLETLRNPEAFRIAAEKAHANGKRIVAYKVGRSAAGARSAASHTGAMAGEDRFFDAFFNQLGVVRVLRYDDLVDVPAALALAPPIAGKRLAILTTTGGAAGLVADVCGLEGFETPVPSAATAQRLAALMQADGYVPDRNPIDLTLAGLDPEVIHGALATLADCGDYDAVVTVIGSSAVGRPTLTADPMVRAAAGASRPIIGYASPDAPAIVQRLNAEGVPAFAAPEPIAAALSALAAPAPRGRAAAASPTAVPGWFDRRAGSLDEAEAKSLFAAFGVPSVKETICDTPDAAAEAAAAVDAPVVVKLLSAAVAHKSEVGGVRVGVAPEDVAAACADIAAAATDAGIAGPVRFLVQERVRGGVEIIVGFARDPVLGPALLIGGGGTQAELLHDNAVRLLPVDRADIEEMLASLALFPLLDCYRGAPRADVAALVDAALGFAEMCRAFGDRLLDAEINPLFVLPEGQGVKAADGLVRFAD
jgi:acyl-CoA synthetase (NDP forming)